MRRQILWVAMAVFLLVTSACLVTPAYADWCLQLSKGLSGDLGFFRFKGKRPTIAGSINALRGRVAGYSPVFGTATVYKDGSMMEVGVTFFADGVQGQFDVYLSGPKFNVGYGYAGYGTYGVNSSVTAKAVACVNEP